MGPWREMVPPCIRPSFPQTLLTVNAYRWTVDKRRRRTTYMDGIRGLAALLVVIHHWWEMDFVHPTASHGFWNYDVPEMDRQWWRLPIVRLLYQGGHAMVPIFFVISGFSLAYKPIEYVRARQFDKVLLNLSSSILRRAPRLVLPPIVMTFFVLVAVRLGWYSNRPLPKPELERLPGIVDQLKDWAWDVTYLPDAFSWDYVIWPKYQPHTWTLNTELQGSKWVYMTILAICTLRQTPRLVLLAWWCLYCLWHLKYWTFLFCSGILIAEFHHIGEAREARTAKSHCALHPLQISMIERHCTTSHRPDTSVQPLAKLLENDDDDSDDAELKVELVPSRNNLLGKFERQIAIVVLLLGLFLCSAPHDEPQTKYMWWNTLYRYCPIQVPRSNGMNHDYYELTQRIYLSIGAVMTVFAISRLPNVQKVFELPAMQYLGQISFSLYLIHGPVIMIVGWATLPFFWYYLNVGTYNPPIHYNGEGAGGLYDGASRLYIELSSLLCLACMLPCMFWGAELFTKYVDEPILRATKNVYAQFVDS